MTDQDQLEIAYHEAGHAVVAWVLGLSVKAVRISFSEEKGWHGGTDVEGTSDHLPVEDQIALCLAGLATEDVFKYKSHEGAGFHDRYKIYELMKANGISEEDQGPSLRKEGRNRARTILQAHRTKAANLAERLVQSGCVDASEFSRLMDG